MADRLERAVAAAGQEGVHRRVGTVFQQDLRIAQRDLGLGHRVEKDGIIADGEDARQFMGDDHHRRPKIVAQRQDQIVEAA
jgi:hypothetical protein